MNHFIGLKSGGNTNGEDPLFKIIDLAVALISFSSIVTALRRFKEKSWSTQEINGLVFLALMITGAITFSMLPFSFFYMGMGKGKTIPFQRQFTTCSASPWSWVCTSGEENPSFLPGGQKSSIFSRSFP
jgi:hypothetical protein